MNRAGTGLGLLNNGVPAEHLGNVASGLETERLDVGQTEMDRISRRKSMYLTRNSVSSWLGNMVQLQHGKGKKTLPTGHVNLRMLAEHLELSQTTVSLVLNNSPSAKSIPQETRARVVEAAKRLNYRPNYFARSLRQSRSMSVGVLAPDLSEGYFTRVMSGVVEEMTTAHYFYFTACHDWKRELIEKYPRMLVERAVDGFLLLNTPLDELEVPVPVVAISAHSADAEGDQYRSGSSPGRASWR